jgi:L-lactate dehydrogenase complex protein LldF
VLGRLGKDAGRITSLPGAGAWTASRDLPSPTGPTFKERWAKQRH